MTTEIDKQEQPCEQELKEWQRNSLCSLIIEEATDADYKKGTNRKQRIAAPESAVMSIIMQNFWEKSFNIHPERLCAEVSSIYTKN